MAGTGQEPDVSRRAALLLLGGIVLFALLLRLLFLQIFYSPDDDVFYLRDAYLLAHGTFVHDTWWSLRLGVIAPTALFIRLFGFHDWSVILYPLIVALLGIPLVFAFGEALFNRTVGLIAAFLLACFPEHIYYSTLVMADLPGAFWGSLAVYLAYQSRKVTTPSRGVLMGLASGGALAMSYLCWEVNMLFVPACCLAAAWDKERRWLLLRLGAILAVLALVLAGESLAYWKLVGDPLWRWTLAHRGESHLHARISLLAYLGRVPRLYLLPARRQFFLYSWMIVGAFIILRRQFKQPPVLMIALWFLAFLLVIGYGVYSVHPLEALLDLDYVRYLDVVTFPAILLISYAIYQTRPGRRVEAEGVA